MIQVKQGGSILLRLKSQTVKSRISHISGFDWYKLKKVLALSL